MSDTSRQPLGKAVLGVLTELYEFTMQPKDLDTENGLFIVRHWDGMDGEWMDITEPVSFELALLEWFERTDGGKKFTSHKHLDYYRIFPSDTRMLFSDGNEMCRKRS
jgi:hypothetical protein